MFRAPPGYYSRLLGVSTMANFLTLFCIVLGNPLERVFPVEVAKDMSVGHLKYAIKERKAPLFDNFSADELTLWRASIPFDDIALAHFRLEDHGQELFPVDSISTIFSAMPRPRHIHIFVVPPIAALAATSQFSVFEKELKELREQLAAIRSPTQAQRPFTDSTLKPDASVKSALRQDTSSNIADNGQPEVLLPATENSDSCEACKQSSAEAGVSIKLCAGCKSVSYCSKECQKADWKKHRPACRKGEPFKTAESQDLPFGPSSHEAYIGNVCITCGVRPKRFPTEASRTEYEEITRICPACWHIQLTDPDSPPDEIEWARRELRPYGRELILRKSPPHAWRCLRCRKVVEGDDLRIHAKECTIFYSS